MEESLVLLYTGSIRGDLDMLPRLHTFIRSLRRTDAIHGVPTILVDVGGSCVLEVWHCAVTQGRSTLTVLDAMGYHAANVSGVLTPDSREKLVEQVSIGLVDAAHPYEAQGIEFVVSAPPHLPAPSPIRGEGKKATASQSASPLALGGASGFRGEGHSGDTTHLIVVLTPDETTRLEGGTLYLSPVEHGQVGSVRIDGGVLQAHIHTLPKETPPDPTIAGVVDFVLSEARYAQKKGRV